MSAEKMLTVDILCKVVDNFGDIGVVYRLARALSELDGQLRLRLIVDNLDAFHSLEPRIDPALDLQTVCGWTVARWDRPASCFSAEPPRLVLECFACGRPDWFEALLFAPERPERRLIVDLEYLTAESWADDFHLIPSITRSPSVAKTLFMPGYTAKTGGLILDHAFIEARSRALSARRADSQAEGARQDGGDRAELAALRLEHLRALAISSPSSVPASAFWLTVFSYERDYSSIVDDIARFQAERRDSGGVLALVAAGKSAPCFLSAWEKSGRPFPVLQLPFLPQTDWDRLLLDSDFLIVRGEDSLSRAVLSGLPFLWQAYPQAEKQQLVKLEALLGRMRHCFAASDFSLWREADIALNDRTGDRADTAGAEHILPLLEWAARAGTAPVPALSPDTPLDRPDALPSPAASLSAFSSFSDEVLALGNLALPLLTLLRDFV